MRGLLAGTAFERVKALSIGTNVARFLFEWLER